MNEAFISVTKEARQVGLAGESSSDKLSWELDESSFLDDFSRRKLSFFRTQPVVSRPLRVRAWLRPTREVELAPTTAGWLLFVLDDVLEDFVVRLVLCMGSLDSDSLRSLTKPRKDSLRSGLLRSEDTTDSGLERTLAILLRSGLEISFGIFLSGLLPFLFETVFRDWRLLRTVLPEVSPSDLARLALPTSGLGSSVLSSSLSSGEILDTLPLGLSVCRLGKETLLFFPSVCDGFLDSLFFFRVYRRDGFFELLGHVLSVQGGDDWSTMLTSVLQNE